MNSFHFGFSNTLSILLFVVVQILLVMLFDHLQLVDLPFELFPLENTRHDHFNLFQITYVLVLLAYSFVAVVHKLV